MLLPNPALLPSPSCSWPRGGKSCCCAALEQSLPVALPSHGNPQLRNCRWFLVLGEWPCWEPGDISCLSYPSSSHPILFSLGINIMWEATYQFYTGETFCHLHFQHFCPQRPSARFCAHAALLPLTHSIITTWRNQDQQTFCSVYGNALAKFQPWSQATCLRTHIRCHPLPKCTRPSTRRVVSR